MSRSQINLTRGRRESESIQGFGASHFCLCSTRLAAEKKTANRAELSSPKHQSGTTMVEILVSIVVISIGLLGLAAMQNASLRLSYESYIRSQANFLAYDLIDRIRANPNAPSYELSVDATLSETDCFSTNSSSQGCNTTQLREHDLFTWRQQARKILPDAQVEISYDDTEQLYSMRIKWQDRSNEKTDKPDEEIVSKEFVYHFKVDNS